MKCKDPKHPQPPESPAVQWQFSFTRVPGLHHGFYAGKHFCHGELYWFVSLEGDRWVESDGDPRGLLRQDVELLFEPGFWRPLRIATRYIMRRGSFEIFEP
jgi:hypothetical protein